MMINSILNNITSIKLQHNDWFEIVVLAFFAIISYFLLPKDNRKIRRISPKIIVITFLIGFCFSHSLNLLLSFIPLDDRNNTNEILQNTPLCFVIIKAVILAPIAEELFFRGVLFGRLKERTNFVTAMVISSVFFALFHTGTEQVIYALVFGLFICKIYNDTNNLLAPVSIHSSANFLSIVLTHFGFIYNSLLIKIIVFVTLNIILLFLCLLFKKVLTNDKNRYNILLN